jgi:hypothetical protein
MKKLIISIIILVAFVLGSCKNNEPQIYTSIEGIWRCTEISVNSQHSYLLDIHKHNSDTTLYLISNFYSTGDNEFIVVKLDKSKLKLAEQSSANINIKEFSGTVENMKLIHLQYIVNDGRTDNSITATYNRN